MKLEIKLILSINEQVVRSMLVEILIKLHIFCFSDKMNPTNQREERFNRLLKVLEDITRNWVNLAAVSYVVGNYLVLESNPNLIILI